MSLLDRLPRSTNLMSRDDTAVLVVDVQQRLLPAIPDHIRLVWNIRRLIDAAQILGLPVVATEQYPKGLGTTAAVLAERLQDISEKLTFSCAECAGLFRALADQGRHKLLITGIESHVCVQQTVLDLISEGFRIYIAVDAVASRQDIDYQTALRRMESEGAILTTTEAAMFEWCEVAGTPEFKQIRRLVLAPMPEVPEG